MDDFITEDDLADFMGLDVVDDDRGPAACRAAQRVVRNYMQQEITLHEDDVEYPRVPWGYRRFRLRQRPVRAISSITVDGAALVETTDWRVENSKVILTTPPWSGEVIVTYDHGWDRPVYLAEDPIPDDIIRVALSVARRAYNGTGTEDDEIPMRSETIGGYAYTVATATVVSGAALTEPEMETLDWYVIRLAI